jgi:hypothetical protein
MKRIRNDSGTVIVFVIMFMVAILGLAALSVDFGSWYQAHRHLQGKVDASALAGVQELPYNPNQATSVALDYANRNGGGTAPTVTVTSTSGTNDTINVVGTETAPGIFSKILGIDSKTISARASARVSKLGQAQYVAPIAISEKQKELQCAEQNPTNQASCYTALAALPQGKAGVPGGFQLISLVDGSNPGASEISSWITSGFADPLPAPHDYDSATGNKFCDGGNIQAAMLDVIARGADILMPVYSTVSGNGGNAKYHVIGWVVFHPTLLDCKANPTQIYGYFKAVTWKGLDASSGGPGEVDFGTRMIRLVS